MNGSDISRSIINGSQIGLYLRQNSYSYQMVMEGRIKKTHFKLIEFDFSFE